MPQTDISGAYALIRAHTKTWRDTTFPRTLVVADVIVAYAQSAPRYFDELAKAATTLESAADGSVAYETAKKVLLAIVNRLITDAKAHAETAATVKQLVLDFRSQTMDDRTEIVKLAKKYNEMYGDSSQKSKDLLAEIAGIRASIATLNDDYVHAVVVASTTPTYAFIIPVGTIAAAVVAGVFGDRAIKIKEQIAQAEAQLNLLTAEEKRRTELLAILKLASESVTKIEALMGPAIAGLDKVANCWNAIAGDLATLKKAVEDLKGASICTSSISRSSGKAGTTSA